MPRDLATEAIGLRLEISSIGKTRRLSSFQREAAASVFNADAKRVGADKRLLDANHPAMREVARVKNNVRNVWEQATLPYVQDGVRLAWRQRITEIEQQLEHLKQEYTAAASQLDSHREELVSDAQMRLGTLFNPEDYPLSLSSKFGIDWQWIELQPPSYLQQLSPAIGQRAQQRAQAALEQSKHLAAANFYQELQERLDHLVVRLDNGEDGQAKVFRDSIVHNLTDFADRFGKLDIGSDQALTQFVAEARELVKDVDPKQLRTDNLLRTDVRKRAAQLLDKVTADMPEAPQRRVIRRRQSEEAA